MASESNNATTSWSGQDVCDIFTIQSLSQITQLGRWWFIHAGFDISDHRIHGKLLVMRKGENVDIVDEAGVVYGGAVIDRLVKGIVLLSHGGVIDID